MHLAHHLGHVIQRLGRRLDDHVYPVVDDVELAVGHDARDLDQGIPGEVKPGHLTVDPDETVGHPSTLRPARVSCAARRARAAAPVMPAQTDRAQRRPAPGRWPRPDGARLSARGSARPSACPGARPGPAGRSRSGPGRARGAGAAASGPSPRAAAAGRRQVAGRGAARSAAPGRWRRGRWRSGPAPGRRRSAPARPQAAAAQGGVALGKGRGRPAGQEREMSQVSSQARISRRPTIGPSVKGSSARATTQIWTQTRPSAFHVRRPRQPRLGQPAARRPRSRRAERAGRPGQSG